MAEMIVLAVLGFNTTIVQAHGHGGDGRHGEHPHEHYSAGAYPHDDGSAQGSHYHHSHGDYGEHHHECRSVTVSNGGSGSTQTDPIGEECQNHDGRIC